MRVLKWVWISLTFAFSSRWVYFFLCVCIVWAWVFFSFELVWFKIYCQLLSTINFHVYIYIYIYIYIYMSVRVCVRARACVCFSLCVCIIPVLFKVGLNLSINFLSFIWSNVKSLVWYIRMTLNLPWLHSYRCLDTFNFLFSGISAWLYVDPMYISLHLLHSIL